MVRKKVGTGTLRVVVSDFAKSAGTPVLVEVRLFNGTLTDTSYLAPRVGVGTGDPRLVPGVRSRLRFVEDCD